MSHSKTNPSPYRVQVLDRALAILEVLGHQRGGCSLAELPKALKLHKSTVHRLMMVLERHRLVDKNPKTGRYSLGLKLFELGSKAVAALDLRERARPYLDRVLQQTEETVNFSVLDHGEVVYIEKMETQRNLRMASSVGHRFPAYSTALGKAILAELPEAEVDAILRRWGMKARTPKTITTAKALKAELGTIRIRGYAIDDEENEEGARCVGAAVRNHLGRPVAAISVSGPAFRVSRAKIPLIVRAVVSAALELSADLGYKGVAPEAVETAAS